MQNLRDFHTFLHSFTFVVFVHQRDLVINCLRNKHFHEVPGWRNWQTQRTQNPPVLGTLQVRFLFPAPARKQDEFK